MSTPPRSSRAITVFVPAYLGVVGLILLIGAVWLWTGFADEQFTSILAAVGGLTMWATIAAMLTMGRGGNA